MIRGAHDSVPASSRAFTRRARIDRTNKAIIVQLQQDGRRPSAEIASSLGITAEEVDRRIEELTEQGLIHVVAVTDPLRLGFARQAMVGLTVEGPAKPVAQALARIDEVDYVVISAGSFDILAELVGRSDAHLLELVTSRIRPIPGVTGIHTFLYLELEKQSYAWGVSD